MRTTRPGSAHPLDELCAEVDRLWTTLIAAPPLHGWGSTPRAAFPAVNVRETDDAVLVEAEIPGLAAADVSVSVADDTLVLEGERRTDGPRPAGEGAGDEVVWHRRERGSGRFERRIPLAVAVAADRVEARLVDGVLTVRCPKAPEAQPRRVPVSGG
ncbi:MAG: Hsp20/alpha crystallin family protein [Planctomycetes bacterium]|nr:Hsp20/alpha crystallin family protein [Planctomycetota bacterium]